ncbi:MAG: BrnT family toxin [Rhodobacter sp.]|nr:BrnT family toxin [Rhodobacter sp.]MCY4168370.1 BrnT family toxin [Rhodobacter sp.]MCY4243655.1 BrnT family toxin [Rhodobacter sp.]
MARIATGCMINGRAYVIVYTVRGSAVRIISARRANPKEVVDYEHNAHQD